MLHIASIRCHKSIKIILEIFQAVNIHSGNPPITEQLFFIIHMMPVEHGNGIIRADTAFADRSFRSTSPTSALLPGQEAPDPG